MSAPDHGPAPDSLEEWVRDLSPELGLPPDFEVDIALILDLARDAAHGVARPAAPLTTFLVGFAAASGDGSRAEIERLTAIAVRLAADRRSPPGSA